MPNPNPKTEHLPNTQFKAPDSEGGLISVSVRMPLEMREWLRSLPEGTGYHVRQALREYMERLEKVKQS